MEVYGRKGVMYADNRNDLRKRMAVGYDGFSETSNKLTERPSPFHDPFAHFAAVIRKEIVIPPYDLSSLENNMIVMEILEAAKRSAAEGKSVQMRK
jgi:predicted dehydrogenase